MTLVIGTDEAGYGPNLGPLVVAASAWHVASTPDCTESVLEDAVAEASAISTTTHHGSLWADSKLVYKSGRKSSGHLGALEHGVLSAMAITTGAVPRDWESIAHATGIHCETPPLEWTLLSDFQLPHAIDASDCFNHSRHIASIFENYNVALSHIACHVIHPSEFNKQLSLGLNKSDILSKVTLTLAAKLQSLRNTHEPVLIWCDRHGGRKHYASIISQYFDCPLVFPIEETQRRSAYKLPSSHCQIEFCVGGEHRSPVALASMTAKYVRELSMKAFNTFWSTRSPGLSPTAGYPVDAKRWRHEAQDVIQAEGVVDDDIWRRC